MPPSPTPAAPRHKNERGVVIILFTFLLVSLLGFVALALDVAKLAATRTQLQNAADAAALAGASAVDPESGAIQQDSAVVRAQQTAFLNRAFVDGPEPVLLAAEDIEFPTPLKVKVTVRRSPGSGGSMVVYLARVLGIPNLEIRADATAEAAKVSRVCEGLVPMGPVPPPDAGWFDPSCDVTYELKLGAGNGEQGNYELLDYPPCNEGPCAGLEGGAAIRCIAEHGYGCCLDEGQEFTLTEPGNKVGPFRQGLQARFDADVDTRQGICFVDYHGNGNRILPLPVIETFDVNGKKLVHIIGFAAFFMKSRPPGHGTLQGQFIYDVQPGEGDGNGEGTLYTLRLVE